MDTLVGRKAELKELSKVYSSDEASLVAVYGRRRIGKTYLIQRYFGDKGHYFELTGSHTGKMREQLTNFSRAYSHYFLAGRRLEHPPTNWTEAFGLLEDAVARLDSDKKVVLFFDELPWMDSPRSGFLAALEHFWNAYMSRRRNVIVVVCGSAASWMINKIIKNRGGLHGRLSKKIHLLPFSLSEAEEFLQNRGISLDRKQFIELYMVTGGVAQYLKQIEAGKSAAQNINELCFQPSGYLFNEFYDLYASLFNKFDRHMRVIEVLAKARKGLGKEELLKKAKLTSGGVSTTILNELILSGFISYSPFWGKKKRGGRYRLIDEFSLFHLKWIEGMGIIADPNYWLMQQKSQSWNTWAGYAFEGICLKHMHKIKSALGVAAVGTAESTWDYRSPKGSRTKGAAIDLIVDRNDHCINLCEMKFYNDEFTITEAYSKNLQHKKSTFDRETQTKKTIFTTMITTYGTKVNKWYLSSVQNQLTIDDLF